MPTKLIAWTALTVALALAALPGAAASSSVPADAPIPEEAFQEIAAPATVAVAPVDPLDPAARSDSFVGEADELIDAGGAAVKPAFPTKRPKASTSAGTPGRVWKEPRYVMSGQGTWYDNGTTAAKLPRGTTIVICGAGGCIERIVTDYGPVKKVRIVDLMPRDFVAVCGCPLWTGITNVTVRVY